MLTCSCHSHQPHHYLTSPTNHLFRISLPPGVQQACIHLLSRNFYYLYVDLDLHLPVVRHLILAVNYKCHDRIFHPDLSIQALAK